MVGLGSFIFDSSKGETPQSIAMKRAIAQQIMGRGGQRSARNVGEGIGNALASIGDGIVANVMNRRANRGESEGQASANELYNSIVGGITGGIPMPEDAGELAATNPSTFVSGSEQTIATPPDMSGNDVYTGFMDTVKTKVNNPFALAAIASTGKRESSFDPKKAVSTWSDPSESGQAGTSGGIMSWRGPRYQALAATGDLSPQGQANFFLNEDPQLIERLNNAKSVEEAQSLMNNAWRFAGYNRPGGEAAERLNLARSYLPTFQGNTQVASNSPQAAIDAIAAPSGTVNPSVQVVEPQFDMGRFGDPINLAEMPPSPEQLQGSLLEQQNAYMQAPPMEAPVDVPTLPATPYQQQTQQQFPPVEVAQAGNGYFPPAPPPASIPSPAQQQQRLQLLMKAAGNQFLNEGQRSVANMLLQQELQRIDPRYSMQMEADRLGLTKAQLEIAAMQRPKPQALVNAGDGRVYDPNTGQWIVAPDMGSNTFRQATPEEAQMYGAAAGQFGPDNRFYPINPPSGTSLNVNPDGTISFNQGAGVKPLTEGQSKDTVYATRAEGALPLIDEYGDALISPVERAMDYDPTGVVRGQQSPEFQMAKQAGDEFLQAILRKDTGAAITTDEMNSYGRTYLPMPGDSQQVLAQKRIARARALEAMKAGMPPNAILAQEKALSRSSGNSNTGTARISDKSQYDALPSGSEYIAPDGSIRRKP